MSEQESTNVLYEVEDKVAVVTFDRPDQLNAMNRRMMDGLVAAVRRLDSDPNARVGLLTGAGKAFMAGADIKEYASQTPADFRSFQTYGRELYAAIEGNSKPVIAAVNGYAFGGGFEIALACDMIVAAAGAKMGLPEIRLNLIPGGGGTQRLPARIGLGPANELLMSGRAATAEELHSLGLVNHVYPAGTFLEDARVFAAGFTDKPPDVLRVLKQLTRLAVRPMDAAAQCLENEALERFFLSEAGQSAVQAFYRKSLEKSRKSDSRGD